MVSGEVIGFSVLGAVAFIILVIYLCKCYHDCTVGQNKNDTPVSSDPKLSLLIGDPNKQEPLPYDPYCDDNTEFIKKDHNDLDVVAMSVQQFHRKQTYLKSVHKSSSKKEKKSSKYSLLSKAIQDENNCDENLNNNGDITIDGDVSGLKSPTTFEAKRRIAEQSIQASVTVHHSIKKNDPHIYAHVIKSPDSSDATFNQVPTYFRPVEKSSTSVNKPSMKPMLQVLPSTTQPNSLPMKYKEPIITEKSALGDLEQRKAFKEKTKKEELQIEFEKEVILNNEASESMTKSEKSLKSAENIPPNKQVVESEENVFFIPESIMSPNTPQKGTRKKSKGTLQTLDDCISETPTKSNKKTKKGTNGNGGNTTPKTPKKRKKSVTSNAVSNSRNIENIDNFDSDFTPKSPVPMRSTPYSGLCSPPLPPRNSNTFRNNPISPTLDTHKQMEVRTSQL